MDLTFADLDAIFDAAETEMLSGYIDHDTEVAARVLTYLRGALLERAALVKEPPHPRSHPGRDRR